MWKACFMQTSLVSRSSITSRQSRTIATTTKSYYAPITISAMALKRKAATSVSFTASKSSKTSAASQASSSKSEQPVNGNARHDANSIIDRRFYPPPMTNERCEQYKSGEIPRPLETLHDIIRDTKQARDQVKPGKAVLHWYKRDLRLFDNRGLSMAADKAKSANIPLICLYIVSPQDYQAHFTSPARVDFELRTLEVMKKDLDALDIPLVVESIDRRKAVPGFILDLCEKHQIRHIYCNIEYEVDELRREAMLINKCLDKDISFTPVHDDVIVAPGSLETGTGNQYAVYTPWFRSWVKHVTQNPDLLEPSEKPGKNPSGARNALKALFERSIPPAPANKLLSKEEKKRMAELWPAGEHEANLRLNKFIKERIEGYSDNRNIPAGTTTSVLSVHHSTGTLAARTSVRVARNVNTRQYLNDGKKGISTWISEVAWRDFYKHVLAHWPYVCMYMPFKHEYSLIEWEYNDEHFELWTDGMTGFPIVDAAMRQLKSMKYMHNRCRMIVASFLAKDLLLDWRLGEKYFMEQLIDGDFASNNGGWGFSASTGVDPQPYFRIFNPLLQSEKFDPDGEYIRKWVPELKDVQGKAIHDPYGRGANKIAAKSGYPKPIVEHKQCRERALSRYKAGLGKDTS
ncbi:photolyase [Microthyrium microscopicum]|uniref:Photolyase n=1 Tax=Microthyrium microscopicum TaxID=703497 RepID=A0A6A6UA73_9PEZI|nr:photolyase [Microthyrium microscopicum]